jgi:hypothetical protein
MMPIMNCHHPAVKAMVAARRQTGVEYPSADGAAPPPVAGIT